VHNAELTVLQRKKPVELSEGLIGIMHGRTQQSSAMHRGRGFRGRGGGGVWGRGIPQAPSATA